ncbi:MAG: 23S rRNA (cytosine1962-C5)-methyltransferase [Limisphaerales bacterium]|nr:MAG: 23S rRNA (cytosine1962-C5)-methyltransferase [Limisphaerales bacterium]KAG0507985.1 MAG: 23S rRNA (cytosine1962-C5)-methyltransferase [Limisphaerales bacterium]TXT48091.1 MAG: 23S rRNA (cytosine1962-C5)-methyltransferase [Limisphaerales bacterium]
MADAPSNPPRLRLRVTATAESMIRGGHPWLFDASIREQNRPGTPGELAVIFDRRDKFLALGLYDPLSPIRVRVLHHGKPATADDAWWRARLRSSLARRDGLFDAQTIGYRCLSGESDGWPGLVLDRYDTTFVLKLYTAAWLPRVGEVVGWLGTALRPERLVLRLSRNIQTLAEKEFNLRDGQVLAGPAPAGPVIFLETGIRFEAEVIRGQKTGFFLDQRENRRRVETLAAGRDVLNAFSFSGGFSLYAARGGARSTTDLDISPHALDSARRNFALNAADPHIAACHHECAQADTFDWLAASSRADFDLAILDPPSLAKRETERAGAIQAYRKLTELGLPRLRRGGILVAASCSAHVSTGEFFTAVLDALHSSRRPFVELARTTHAPDHPATFPEAQYLKCLFARLEP